MNTIQEIIQRHLKTCYAVHGIQISEKYERHIKRAMKEYAIQNLKQVYLKTEAINGQDFMSTNVNEIIKEIENEK